MGRTLFFAVLAVSVATPWAIRSPKGAQHVTVRPMINQEDFPFLPGCADVEFDRSDVIQDPLMWPWSGLSKYSREVYEAYQKQLEINIHTVRYQVASQSRRLLQAESDEAALQEQEICVARQMVLNQASLSEGLCQCLSLATPEAACLIQDIYSTAVHCHDAMAEQVNAEVMCPALLTESLGVEMSPMCSGHVSGTVESLNLDLFALHFDDAVPDRISNSIVSQEARAYYVAWKAVEKFTKWANAHRFCSATNPDHEVLQDLEVLPSWTPKVYFWLQDHRSQQRIPIAVLAQRDRGMDIAEVENFENTILVIRNVMTTFEGRLSLTNQFSRAFRSDDIGAVHEGYDALASQMVSVISIIMKDHYGSTLPRRPKFTTIGHGSFGAGVGAIVARDLANQFTTAINEAKIEHNLIAFEGGPVGNYEFTDDLRTKVNVRNIVSTASGSSSLPCEKVKACNGGLHEVHTGVIGERIGPFMALPGQVTADVTTFSNEIWGIPSIRLEAVANLICAAPCWMSSNFCSDDPAQLCTYSSCGVFMTDEARESG